MAAEENNTPEVEIVSTALTLPGADAVDHVLATETVEHINRIYLTKGLETARMIGEYVLEVLFGGDTGAFEESGKKHASFRAVAEHPELQMSASWLWYAVRLVPHLRQLPEDVAKALPMSHHRLLMHVKDEKKREQIARKAAERGMSKRELESEIKRRKPRKSGPKVGRPELPSFVKGVTRLRKAVEVSTKGKSQLTRSIVEYGSDKARSTLRELEVALAELSDLRDSLQASLSEAERIEADAPAAPQ